LSLTQLLLPIPLSQARERIKQRWWDNTFPQTIVGATLETVQMALAGTFLALIVAFPLGFLAARNTSPHPLVYHSVRIGLNFLRTIPDLALGLVFVAAVGLGAFAGTLALAIHTATVLGKLLSESVENIDEGVVEAIRATGAGFTQTLSFAVLPQILPDLISFTLYRLETNIRAASVLGLIGAGGIGYLMNASFRTFQYQEAAAIVIVLIALVMLVDYLSARLRNLVV
jgi:phosphonate transport system permease protein